MRSYVRVGDTDVWVNPALVAAIVPDPPHGGVVLHLSGAPSVRVTGATPETVAQRLAEFSYGDDV